MLLEELKNLASKLDLTDFLNNLSQFFSRVDPFYMCGDVSTLKILIDELETLQFTPPNNIVNLDSELLHIKKYGVLKLDAIFQFVRLIRYFIYIKNLNTSNLKYLSRWLNNIVIPESIVDIVNIFDGNGNINEGIYPKLDSITNAISSLKMGIKSDINKILNANYIAQYLVDRNIHLIDSKECLLLPSKTLLKPDLSNKHSLDLVLIKS